MSLLTPSRQQAADLERLREAKTFIRSILKEDPYDLQDAIIDALESHNRVAIKGCHSAGKSRVIAAYCIYYLLKYPDSIVLTTAPTEGQVQRLMWASIDEILERANMKFPKRNELEIRLNPRNYMLGLATNQGVRFQGYHSRHILIVFDEAPGIMADIWDATNGIAASGEVKIVALGNPVIPSGKFYECFKPNNGWHQITISAFDTPNLQNPATGQPFTIDELLALEPHELSPNAGPRPYLVSREWVLERYRATGPQDPDYQSRVLGQFPDEGSDSLIAYQWIHEARMRGLHWTPGETDVFTRYTAGVDVADGGDDASAVSVWRGNVLVALDSWYKREPFDAIRTFLEPFHEELTFGHTRPAVRVDTIGVGANMLTLLNKFGYSGHTIGINVASSPDLFIPRHRKDDCLRAKERFSNLKAYLYWQLRERFQRGEVIGYALSEQAATELASLRWRANERNGKIEIEPKSEMKKRGADSPNLAECMMLGSAAISALPIVAAVSYRSVARKRRR